VFLIKVDLVADAVESEPDGTLGFAAVDVIHIKDLCSLGHYLALRSRGLKDLGIQPKRSGSPQGLDQPDLSGGILSSAFPGRSRICCMKEDVLHQIVQGYLQLHGYLTITTSGSPRPLSAILGL
jgi:hypothetical protein